MYLKSLTKEELIGENDILKLMNTIKVQTLKGFRDFLPQQMRKRQYVINKLKEVFESFGFEPLETPALEYEEILLGKYGEEGDKLMYRFTDNGDRRVALRYDQTVPLARVVAQYGNQLPTPFKRYQIQPVWRAENTQKGRFREFLQCDIDTVGTPSANADLEILQVAYQSLKKLGFNDFKILINDRNIFSKLLVRIGVKEKDLPKVIRSIDKFKKIGKDGVIDELIKNGFDKDLSTSIVLTMEQAEQTIYLTELFCILGEEDSALEYSKFEFDPTLARGLDYYTSLIFEAEIEGYEAGSVLGGGRYDNLIGMFSGSKVPAVGFAFGFDRLIGAMDQLGLFPDNLTTTKVLVTEFSMNLGLDSIKAANKLRKANINTELWLESDTKLEKQLKYADLKGIPYVVIIGPEEAKNNTVTIKNLKDKTQETLSLDELISKLSS